MAASRNINFTTDDFKLIDRGSQDIEYLVAEGPSLSYWREAWCRLKMNRRALLSLFTILFLLLFTWVGPWVWTLDPARQDLVQISRAPHLGISALVVDDNFNWSGVIADNELTVNHRHVESLSVEVINNEEVIDNSVLSDDASYSEGLAAPSNLRVVDKPNTEYVRLTWQPVVGAARYLVYRNERQPESATDLGVPLWETDTARDVSYQDRLKLEAITYYYSVVATDGLNESNHYAVIQVDVQQAITFSDAVYSEVLPPEASKLDSIGRMVELQAHPLGTDYLGRDMLSRLMLGARISLFIGIVAPFLYLAFGIIYGSVAGFFGGLLDEWMMRFADFVIALPFLLFMILFKVSFGIGPGESGVIPMLVAMIVLSWPSMARLARGQVLQLREQPYIEAAKLFGASSWHMVFRHMLPNMLSVILVSLTFAIPAAIFTEAFLSFIGMGVVPPTPSWGSMSHDGMKTLMTHPHELIFPALFISITVLAFNILGDGLRDALDVRIRE